MIISGSLVLYKSRQNEYEDVIQSFLLACDVGDFYVIDNSPSPSSSKFFSNPRVKYCHLGVNLGFGAAHNEAIKVCCNISNLHLIINPDINFNKQVLVNMVQEFRDDPSLVVAMPRVNYPNGELQRLCKLLPTPIDLLIRRFLPIPYIRSLIDARYELHCLPQDCSIEVPTLSGCFLLVRSKDLIAIGGFDPNYFMYLEDVDLVRRLSMRGLVKYLPATSIIHYYEKGSYRNIRLLSYHIVSAIKYFNKWGWFFDSGRKLVNNKILFEINKK
jgi:GT2 family glycosyltransferase